MASLDKILPLLPRKTLVGIRTIVLLDDDYRREGKGRTLGRYVPVSGTKLADIELYFASYNHVPEEAKTSPRYWLFTITTVLAHELYHHEIRFRRKHLPAFRREQAAADRWGTRLANQVYHGLPDCEAHWEEWDRIRQAFDRQRRGLESDPG